MTKQQEPTLEQIEWSIDYYQDMIKFEKALVRDGLSSSEISEKNIKAFEDEARRLLQISVDRRKAAQGTCV